MIEMVKAIDQTRKHIRKLQVIFHVPKDIQNMQQRIEQEQRATFIQAISRVTYKFLRYFQMNDSLPSPAETSPSRSPSPDPQTRAALHHCCPLESQVHATHATCSFHHSSLSHAPHRLTIPRYGADGDPAGNSASDSQCRQP
jgi:hypothetical protein